MRTIIHFIIIVQMIVFAACVPASALPSSSLLHNSQHQLDKQPLTQTSIDIHHDLTASPHPLEGYSGVGLASRKEIGSPNADDQDYGNCVLQAEGFGPLPDDDTPSAFRHFKYFHNVSKSAPSPPGYMLVVRDLNGAIENDLGFLGTHLLQQYDPDDCARLCNDLPTCASFNLYFERDPIYKPDTTAGCPSPPSTTNINCVLWHSHLETHAATNLGELREGFQVVIAGSNLYNKINWPLDLSDLGFSGPRLDVDNDAAFSVPDEPTGGYSTLLEQKPLYYSYYDASVTLEKYDPIVCAHLCSNITNAAEPSFPFTKNAYPVCSMFVAYELRHYSDALAMVCELYSSVWSSHYQTVREVVAYSGEGETTVTLQPHKVSVYQRNDYQYLPICAMEEHCGKDFYAGGDCSGWGQGYC